MCGGRRLRSRVVGVEPSDLSTDLNPFPACQNSCDRFNNNGSFRTTLLLMDNIRYMYAAKPKVPLHTATADCIRYYCSFTQIPSCIPETPFARRSGGNKRSLKRRSPFSPATRDAPQHGGTSPTSSLPSVSTPVHSLGTHSLPRGMEATVFSHRRTGLW